MKSRSGFTIVEIIVIITIIAILASVSAFAYSGIQQRAKNSNIISAAEQWIKVLTIAYGQKGSITLTDVTSTKGVCLGEKANYPAVNGFASGACERNGSASKVTTSGDLTTALMPYGYGAVPPYLFDYSNGSPSGTFDRGIYYNRSSGGMVVYNLYGEDADCKLNGSHAVVRSGGNTQCAFNLNTASSVIVGFP